MLVKPPGQQRSGVPNVLDRKKEKNRDVGCASSRCLHGLCYLILGNESVEAAKGRGLFHPPESHLMLPAVTQEGSTSASWMPEQHVCAPRMPMLITGARHPWTKLSRPHSCQVHMTHLPQWSGWGEDPSQKLWNGELRVQ